MSENIHEISNVEIPCLNGKMDIDFKCTCQKAIGDRCPVIEENLINKGFDPNMAWIYSILSVNCQIAVSTK